MPRVSGRSRKLPSLPVVLSFHLLASLCLPGVSAPALAQERVGNGVVYQADFFKPFAPATAMQVVLRIPGFQFEDINQDVRGFGQAAGNVVINGARPSAKNDSLETILGRIPAARVVRVEVRPGDAFGAEFAGRPQVANLVLSDDAGVGGTAEMRLRRPFTGEIRVDGKASAYVKRGGSTFNLSADYNNDDLTDFGSDLLTALPGGALIERREKFNATHDPEASLSFGWSHDDGENRTANLNLSYAAGWFRLWQDNLVLPAVGPVRDDVLEQAFDGHRFEVGGDITRPLGEGSVKLVLLATRTERDRSELALIQSGGAVLGGFSQAQDLTEAESLARLVWTRPSTDGWTLELGGEIVLNRLDSAVELAEIDGDGNRVPVDLPLANAVVREVRAEPFVNLGRVLGSGLRLDLGLTFERSRLTVNGDATAERTLSYLKPKASMDWRSGKWQLQGSVQRTVNQLNFGDFISLAELSNDRVNGGNAELVPQTAWEFLLSAQSQLLGSGVLRAELGVNLVQKVQDRIPVDDGLDAPGNLGSGRVYVARLNADVPLDRLGLKGARATAKLSVYDSHVEDPYTLTDRPFTGYTLWVFDAGFRQDLGKFAWGFDTYSNSGSTQYRRNEEDRNFRQNPYVEAFAEYRPDRRTTLTLRVENLLDIDFYRSRTFYDPDRSSPDPIAHEFRKRQEHITPSLTFKRTFG